MPGFYGFRRIEKLLFLQEPVKKVRPMEQAQALLLLEREVKFLQGVRKIPGKEYSGDSRPVRR